jgi:hypothetical protein
LFWEEGTGPLTSVEQYIPETIERITVTFVDMYLPVCTLFLKPLLDAVGSFPHLRKIDVFPCAEGDEAEWENEKDFEGMEGVVTQFRGLNVKTKIWDADVEDACSWRDE